MSRVRALLDAIPQVGRLDYLGVSPARRAVIRVVEQAELRPGSGIEGDHHAHRWRDHLRGGVDLRRNLGSPASTCSRCSGAGWCGRATR